MRSICWLTVVEIIQICAGIGECLIRLFMRLGMYSSNVGQIRRPIIYTSLYGHESVQYRFPPSGGTSSEAEKEQRKKRGSPHFVRTISFFYFFYFH